MYFTVSKLANDWNYEYIIYENGEYLLLSLLVRYYFVSRQPIVIALQHTLLPIFCAFCRAIVCSQQSFVLVETIKKYIDNSN